MTGLIKAPVATPRAVATSNIQASTVKTAVPVVSRRELFPTLLLATGIVESIAGPAHAAAKERPKNLSRREELVQRKAERMASLKDKAASIRSGGKPTF